MKSDLTLTERRALLTLARARGLERKRAELPPIEGVARPDRVPLSFAQQRLWFLEQLGDLGSTHHIHKRIRLQGPLDRAALVRALDAIVARHESLRTTFAQVDGVPEQRIAPAATSRFHLIEQEIELDEIEPDRGGPADAEAELDRLMAEEVRARFDLEHGPLIRGRLIRLHDTDHVLLITTHHIVSDGWSRGVFYGELSALYGAYVEGREAELPELPVQYADYAVWQRRWIDGEVLREQAAYWTRTLAGAPERLALPIDRPRPTQVDHAGALIPVTLDERLTTALKALSRRQGTTLFMTLLAGWAVVLSRLSGQKEVVIGSPTAGRGRRELEGLIGFFVSTLALRIDLSGAPTVAELLARVSRRALEAQQHQDIPFEQVVERLDPTRNLSHHPLFQVAFTWQHTTRATGPRGIALSLPGVALDRVGVGSSHVQANLDLSLSLFEAGDRVTGTLTYATALFDRDTVERHAGYLHRVLQAMVADESQPVARLALMPERERVRVVEAWNQTGTPPAASFIHQLFEAQAARTPDATAVVCEQAHVSYAALNTQANRLAHHLRSLGVGPDVRVAVCVERGPEMVIGLLAVLKAGGAYVALDPAYPADRLAYMLADSAPAAMLTQTHLRAGVAMAGVPIVELDRVSLEGAAPAWAGQPATDCGCSALTPDHLAYVIYTSGSTGRPKGVMNTHRSVSALLAASQEMWGLGTRDAVLQNIPYSFDVSVREVFWPLIAGGRLVLTWPDGHKDVAYLIETMSRERITTLHVPAATLQLFVGHAQSPTCSELTRVLCGGESLSPALIERFYERLPTATLYHMYGPTETTVAVTGGSCRPEDLNGRVHIGRPVPYSRAYVLDAYGSPVPTGVAGELSIGGAQVARGYQGRPAQTAERFVADPFGEEPGARLYRTGDLARWRPDGTLEFLGRIDHQVKVRGFRVELGEIEARLAEHAGVREAVVAAREDTPGDTRLVAYVVGDVVDAETLRAHMGETLPEYMVPAAYVRLDALPLTPNGKVDRKALPAPERDAFPVRAYEAPAGETEQALAEIWAEVLHAERVGRHDHFFELGGHSLLAVQVIARVRQVLAVDVELGQLFTRPVLKDFARELETAARTELPPIEPASRDERVPLSFAQQRLWFVEQLRDLGSTYHLPWRLRLRGELDGAALARTLDAIVARHEALRTTFASVDGVPEQRITSIETSRFTLIEHDLSGEADQAAALDRLMVDEARARVDLEHGPLIRGRLVRLAPEEHVLLLTMHHIVSDEWSIGVLTQELGALYRAFRRGEPNPLPALDVQYADYAVWQRRWVEGDVLREQAGYWTRTLAGAPELLELPTDRPRPAEQDHAGGRIPVVLDESTTTGLKALARRHGATLFMTLLTGWTVVMSRLSGQADVVIGTPTANRGRREIDRLIGFFVNTLPLRLNLSDAPTVAELLGRVKTRVLDAQHHQDIPFEQIVELVDPVRSLAHHPLFQVVFVWRHASPERGLSLPGLELERVGSASLQVQAKTDLSLGLREAGGRIVGSLTYATALFERVTVERFVRYLRRVLEEMVADESQRVARLAILPESERVQVLDEWNRTKAAYPSESCVHELFEAHAARMPEAIAVVCEGDYVTYGELNRRANRLAHHLRALGVGPDVRVAICVERGVAMVVGLLGVLKAGGAYVPLDPNYPAERLAYMLADSAPVVVLTQRDLRERIALADRPVLELDAIAPAWAARSSMNPPRGALTPDHLTCVIYTSGSTGWPKGVLFAHRGLVNLVTARMDDFAIGTDSRVLQFASFSFDACVFEVSMALFRGAVLCVLPGETRVMGDTLATLAGQHRITHAVLPQSLLAALPDGAPPDGAPLRTLRSLITTGEAPSTALIDRWRMDRQLINGYGPTETTICSTLYAYPAGEVNATCIGTPIANTHVYVLDDFQAPAPVGVAGELYIGGVNVARGYLGRPALTAERFVVDPYSGQPGARLYRTGDLGRWRSDGTLEFLGRADHQVKVRGFRVELGEIEARLLEYAGVREAVVLAREDTPGQKRLVAYVVEDEPTGAEPLRAHLQARLPDYMIPAAYVRLDALPLTPNGKLDRKALPAPEGDAYAVQEYEAPVGEAEQALAGIWADVLGIERVGRHDNFFELGGHSLLAVQVIARMRQRGLHAEVRALFTAPTLMALAADVGAEEAAVQTAVQVPPNGIPAASAVITPEMLPLVTLSQAQVDAVVATVPGGAANVQDIYPLAPLQEGLLFHYLLAAEGDPYLLGTSVYFPTRERLDAYLIALDAVIRRHDVLRTAIVWQNLPEAVQVVWREAPLVVEAVDLDPAAGDVAGQLYRRFDPRQHRIDIRRAPLMRGYIARDAVNDAARQGWVLLLLRHHLAGDHTAGEVMRHEIDAHLAGRADALSSPLPFRNYVAQVRLGVSHEEHQAFFTELLGDVDEPTAPFGLLDVRGDGTGIDEARVRVEGQLAVRLRARARALGVSAATLCHVAWAQVLAAVSGQQDVVFGTVLFGRMDGGEGADRVMGPFINTLPIRIRLGNIGADAGVRQTHALLARLLRHEHASLALAQRCSAVEAPAPLFTTLFNYRHGAKGAKKKTRADATRSQANGAGDGPRRSYTEERSNYPLTMTVDDLGEGLALTAKVKAQGEARRVCSMMHTALEGLVDALEAGPRRAVGSIGVLPADERDRVLYEWNRTGTEFPQDTCVHELFEEQAERRPDDIALVFAGAPLTYGELNRRANRLAHYLREQGVGPDVRVGICMERCLEMVVGLFGVLKAGGAYVPLDPNYPQDRLQNMVEDSAPVVLLTQSAVRDRVKDLGVAIVALDADAASWAERPATNPPRGPLDPDHLTHLIYTSGSTGRPKGVMMAHRGGVNRFQWMQRLHQLGVHDTGAMLQNSSFSFDASVWELLFPLSAGARVVLSPPQAHWNLDGLVETIRQADVRAAFFVPSMLQLLLESGGLEHTGLRRVMCGGEALPPALARRLQELIPDVELFNMFGPSEASQAVTGRVRLRESDATVPLGRPVPNTRIYILDTHGAPAPIGVPGELYVGGVQMARGYLDRPELTAERFLPDPYGPYGGEPGARCYRTGDLARWRPDGTIEFLGRMDFQVKVRGFRIEPAEIEARLAEHPGVRAAAVLAREDTPGEKRLVAYVVGDEPAGADVLRAHLSARLPDYMVPAAYVRLDALPLTPNGKLDRKALPAPEGEAYATRAYEAPAGGSEQALAEIWAEVLRVDRVGRWDDFFALGGHSVLAVRVISRVRQILGVDVALGDVFTRAVLKDFARGLEAAARSALPPIEPAPREGRLPLSLAQQRLWILEQMGGLGSTYYIHKRRRLRGDLDRRALQRALDRIVARHEALRTTFAQVDGIPEQCIAPANIGFLLVDEDLEGREDASTEFDRLRLEEAQAPFDLERGPLVRGRLLRLAPDHHVLLVTIHHIVCDAWSSGVFFDELSTLYAAYREGSHREGKAANLPALPVQYVDYAIWQRRWIEGDVLRKQADYWTKTLSGAPALLELPTDHPRPARMDHAGAILPVEFDEELTVGLKTLSRRHGTTLYMTLLAGWAVVLSRVSGQEEVVIGSPTANRGRREIEGLIGFFINTLALRLDLSGAPDVAALLKRVKERTIEAQSHQDIPFEQVVELLEPTRSLSHNPLFQVNFTWQNVPQGDGLSLPGLELNNVGMGAATVPAFVDMGLELSERQGRLRGVATYATALFERDTVERFVGYLRRVLAEMVADDTPRVDRLPLLPADERSRVLDAWNRTEADYPAGSCIHELFESHVERAPAAGALIFEDERLSYAELNARANRLAHHLRALGVGPDVRVAICVERGVEMVVALLGVLKAGGAHVTLDPGYPSERLAFMLADSTPAVMLTQSSVVTALAAVFAEIGGGVPVLELDAVSPPWLSAMETNPSRDALTPEHAAYVIYTSGSTGRPKGVLVPHRGLCNVAVAQQRAFGVGPGDRVLQFASLSFDASVFELIMALASGAALCVARRDDFLPGPGLLSLLRRHAITTVTLPPSALAALPMEDLPALRTITVAGEALSAELVARWGSVRSGGHHRLLNLYGPSEATIWSTWAECVDPLRKPDIGFPIANTRAYVLDDAFEPLPEGVAGELYVGGAGVARAYLHRPGLTAERFVPDPFGSDPGARLYRTGDRVRRLRDGRLDFIGRVDHQVKVRGFRIELGEIEARLAEHPAVREAVVVAREDTPGDKRLVAYVVGDEAGADMLRAHLSETLPEYMVPAAYVRLEQFPLTPNGKLDRKALPAPEGDAYAARLFEAPVGAIEQAIAGIWADVLGLDRVGRHDNFFELGGHSLLAVQVIAHMREIDLHVEVQALFEAPTLAALAAAAGGDAREVAVPDNRIPHPDEVRSKNEEIYL